MKHLAPILATLLLLGSTGFAQPPADDEIIDDARNAEVIRYDREPSIQEVQEAALRYYKLDVATLDSLQTRASLKGLMPTFGVSGGYSSTSNGDETVNDEYSQNVAWLINRAIGNSFSISGNLSWNLPSLVYSGEALAVMGRAGNRESLLKEVTKAYYERKKAKLAQRFNPPKDEESRQLQLLRIDELTAILDAYTGGWFSQGT